MTRDIHSPANIRPEDYEYVEMVYLGPVPTDPVAAYNDRLGADGLTYHEASLEVAASPYEGNFKRKGTCDHCGARFFYGAIYAHLKSEDMLVVGNICADEVFGSSSKRELDLKRAKDVVRLARERTTLGRAIASFFALHEGLETALTVKHEVSHSLRGSLIRYGSLTDKQVELAFTIAQRVSDQEREVVHVHADVVPGLRDIQGRVLTKKFVDNAYGGALKMLVLTETDEKVWGTIPAALLDAKVQKGDIVKFKATIEVSENDPKFGFFSRPRKASIVQTVEAGEIERLLEDSTLEPLRVPLLALRVGREAQESLVVLLRAEGASWGQHEERLWKLAGY